MIFSYPNAGYDEEGTPDYLQVLAYSDIDGVHILESSRFRAKKYKHYVKKVKNKLIGAIKYCVGEYCCCKKNEAIEKEYNQSIDLVKTISYSNLSLKNRIALFLIKHNRRFYWMRYRKRRDK